MKRGPTVPCGVCRRPIRLYGAGYSFEAAEHPLHTDAELAETKAAVDAAAGALAFLFHLSRARAAVTP